VAEKLKEDHKPGQVFEKNQAVDFAKGCIQS
jgi:hypothetical protein